MTISQGSPKPLKKITDINNSINNSNKITVIK